MNIIERGTALALEIMPTDEVRQALLPPVRALREVAVSVAATVRHWELALEGHDQTGAPVDDRDDAVAHPPVQDPSPAVPQSTADALVQVGDDTWDDIGGAPVTSTDETSSVVDVRDLVDEWPQLSFADAQARLHGVDAAGLRSLIAYESEHGHRVQYTLMLEQRLSALTAAVDD